MLPTGGMHVVLRDAQGEALASKTFDQLYSCAERAQVVAVFATTWDTAAGLGSALDDVEADPPEVAAPTVVPHREAMPPTGDVAKTASAPKSAAGLAWRLGVGLAAVSGLNFGAGGQGLGFALELEARPSPLWGVKTELYGLPDRELGLGTGQAVWSRYGGGVGLRGWQPRGFGAFTLDMGVHLAYTTVQGQGFAVNTSSGALIPGAKLALGADWSLGKPLHMAVDLGVLVWGRREAAAVAGQSVAQDLPRADLLLRVLLTWEQSKP